MDIRLINPRGRVIVVDETTLKREKLLEKGFVYADEDIKGNYVPSLDVGGELPVPTISEEPKIPQADINFCSIFWSSNGMGRVGEETLLEIDKLGYKVNVVPYILEKDGLKRRTLELLSKQYTPSQTTLFYAIPEMIERYKTDINYIKLPWDTTKAPRSWVDILNKYPKKIYTTSGFTKDVLKESGVVTPLSIAKDGVRSEDYPYIERDWNNTFYFMTAGDLSTRKGTDVLLNAFKKAFPHEKDVGLIMKTNHTPKWGKFGIPEDKRIELIIGRLPREGYLELLRRANCFVFPSRAEGFGLPPLEAMSTGLPVILHNWSGLSAMANDRYNYPIGTEGKMKADPSFYPEDYGDIGDWGNPSEKELVDMMRYIYQRRDEAKTKGKRASEWVKKVWQWDSPVKEMMAEITGKKTSVPTWGEFYQGDTLTKNNVQDSVNSHKELFWMIRGFNPETIIEAGTGTGEMAAWLTWKDQSILGKEPTAHHAKKVFAVDNDASVLKLAKVNMDSLDGRAKLINADAFNHEEGADLLFAQGMLEHLSDEEMVRLVDHQLKQAPVVIHSVPNDDYGKYDYGNERLLPDDHFYNLFEHEDLTILRYWNEGGVKKQSTLIFKSKDKFQPEVSVVMPVFNGKEMTIKAIECIRKNTKDYELIVIDNNSDDGISEWLDKQDDIRTLHLPINSGVPYAKNLGMALAYGKYVCFLDNDTEVGEGWMDTLLSVFKDQSVGFTAHEGYEIDIETKSFNAKKVTGGKIQWASGSCFVFPRKLIKQTGLLIDKEQWCIEDVDFCFKIRNLGYKGSLPEKSVNIVHLGGTTAKQFSLYSDTQKFRELSMNVWNTWEDFILHGTTGAKIDIGVGDAPHTGHVHVDIQNIHHVDIVSPANKLPFPDNSIEVVRNAHLIEHIQKEDVDDYIRKWYRVLEDGGTLRVICPDFVTVCEKVANKTVSIEQGMRWMFGGRKDEYDVHYWYYTEETLKELFVRNGFVDIKREENADGWLQVSGKKVLTPQIASGDPTIGFYNSHHHIFGGGENLAFRVLEILQKNYPKTFNISEGWQIDPKQAFDIKVSDAVQPVNNPDVYVNFSHGYILDPNGKKNICFIFYPQFNWKDKIKKYDKIITLSEFSREKIREKWGVDSTVIYPPTDLDKFYSTKKKNQIICVGRFFQVEEGNNKNQDLLVEAFKKLKGDWNLVFVGSNQDNNYYSKVKEMAKGSNIEFRESVSVEEMRQLYAESKILWHAAGWGAKNPSGYEHFGIVAVEALASGCRALVYGEGGIVEIKGVEPWHTFEELVELTEKENDVSKVDLTLFSISEAEKKWKEAISACL